MRAREPDSQGYVDVEGVRLGWESFNDDGETAVVFAPIDTCVHSRAWKAQVAYLAQHYRVVTIDPPGNGRSGRSLDPAAYDDLSHVADTVAVLDHLGIEKAVLAGICVSAWQSLLTAALHPDRVLGVVAVAPWARDFTPPLAVRLEAVRHFDEELDDYSGWYGWNKPLPPGPLAGVRVVLLRPDAPRAALHQAARGHPRVQLRDQRAGDAGGEREQAVPGHGRAGGDAAERDRAAGAGDPGHRRPVPAARPGRERRPLDRRGAPRPRRAPATCRWPVIPSPVNRAIKSFVDRAVGAAAAPVHRRTGTRRPPRALYLSSPIGLGHVRRDLAIADAMREQRPDLEIQWLTQSPVAEFLERRGEVRAPGVAAAGQRVGPLRVRVG